MDKPTDKEIAEEIMKYLEVSTLPVIPEKGPADTPIYILSEADKLIQKLKELASTAESYLYDSKTNFRGIFLWAQPDGIHIGLPSYNDEPDPGTVLAMRIKTFIEEVFISGETERGEYREYWDTERMRDWAKSFEKMADRVEVLKKGEGIGIDDLVEGTAFDTPS